MRTLRDVGLILIALIGMPCAEGSSCIAAEQSGTISGVALRPESRLPFAGGAVAVVEAKRGMLLGEDGTFRFEGLKPGAYTIRVQGLLVRSRPVTVQARAGEDTRVEILVELRGLSVAEAAKESIGVALSIKPSDIEFQIKPIHKSPRVGEPARFSVRLTNHSKQALFLVPSLDGSTDGGRFPQVSIKIRGPVGGIDSPRGWRFCGNMNGLGASDLVEVKPGEEFDPFAGGWDPDLGKFAKPGHYAAVFHYSTNQRDVRKWLGWPPPDRLPEEVSLRFRGVPLLEDSCSTEFDVEL
ncbi:MAG: carboxypeptidase regulatory-like domain-containing protein [Candidatus Eisenbacteria bacterium]|nr:carboxypeptidase regulatory-like domain-containing protein [Candidatus Eisenbacteria bacterium]